MKKPLLKFTRPLKALYSLILLSACLCFGGRAKAQTLPLYICTSDGQPNISSANDVVMRINPDGTNSEVLNSGFTDPKFMLINLAGQQIYMCDQTFKFNTYNLGTNVGTDGQTSTPPINPVMAKYDEINNLIYTVGVNQQLSYARPNFNFSSVAFSAGTKLAAFALDVAHSRVFLVNNFSVTSHNLITSSLTGVVKGNVAIPLGNKSITFNDIQYDPATDYVYIFTTTGLYKIHPDGTGFAQVGSSVASARFSTAFDVLHHTIYYVSSAGISSIDLNTAEVKVVFTNTPNVLYYHNLWMAQPARLATAAASNITTTSATLGGNILQTDYPVTERGVVYSTTSTLPVIDSAGVTKAANGSGTGSFSATISGLSLNTTYYARAYAISAAGTAYDPPVTFKTLGLAQTITFNALPAEIYSDLALTATASSGLAVTYASSDTTVASIANGSIHFKGTGIVQITASQGGGGIYNAAANVSQSVILTHSTALANLGTNTNSNATRVSVGMTENDYTMSVGAEVGNIQFTARVKDPNSTITVNGAPLANNAFSADIPLTAPQTVVTLVVTTVDSSKRYVVTISKNGSNNAELKRLANSTPANFVVQSNTATAVAYTLNVSTGTAGIIYTPTAVDAGATITINGTPVNSGSPSALIPLTGTVTTTTVIVTAADHATTKTYTVTVNKAGSNNASLSRLGNSTSSDLVVQSNTATALAYTINVSAGTTGIAYTPTAVDAAAAITINGTPINSGATSALIPLTGTTTTTTIVVTAGDGITTKTYTVAASKAGSNNASLSRLGNSTSSDLVVQSNTATALAYTLNVGAATTGIVYTPTAADAGATITINGTPINSGSPSALIPLTGTSTTTTIIVKASDGLTTKTYTVTASKAGSNNASLSRLGNSTPSDLVVQSNTATALVYTMTVKAGTTSIFYTPTAVDPAATITINGTPINSGAASAVIPLTNPQTTTTIIVKAGDGITTKTYTVTVTVPPNSSPMHLQNDGIASTLNVHQVVSPNGDGINDVLAIDGIEQFANNHLTIVNSSGALVYDVKGYGKAGAGFNGYSNKTGALQKAGTYYYSLVYTDGNETKRKSGYILLKY